MGATNLKKPGSIRAEFAESIEVILFMVQIALKMLRYRN